LGKSLTCRLCHLFQRLQHLRSCYSQDICFV
jgi:hypothetical protein